MPGESTSEPSAALIAWSWIIEELADCKEIDTSILGSLVKWNPSIIEDPIYGESARRRLELRFLEELANSNVDSESLKIEGLNDLPQMIQQRREALPKTTLDLLKQEIIKESGSDSIIISKRPRLNASEPHAHEQERENSINGKPSDNDQDIAMDSSSDGEDSLSKSLRLFNSKKPQKEENSCVKCDERGDLLLCRVKDCPVAIHSRCLGSDSMIDNPEDFKCPPCSYSQALSEYEEAKKKLCAASKSFTQFLDSVGGEIKRVEGLTLERETLANHIEDPAPSSEVRDREHDGEGQNALEGESSDRNKMGIDINEKDLEANAGEVPRKQRRAALKPKRYKNPLIPWARRKRLPWTKAEEAMLKEAMEKIYPNIELGNSEISWIKLRDYGEHIFHRTRKPMDLKDKWRNINSRRQG